MKFQPVLGLVIPVYSCTWFDDVAQHYDRTLEKIGKNRTQHRILVANILAGDVGVYSLRRQRSQRRRRRQRRRRPASFRTESTFRLWPSHRHHSCQWNSEVNVEWERTVAGLRSRDNASLRASARKREIKKWQELKSLIIWSTFQTLEGGEKISLRPFWIEKWFQWLRNLILNSFYLFLEPILWNIPSKKTGVLHVALNVLIEPIPWNDFMQNFAGMLHKMNRNTQITSKKLWVNFTQKTDS